MQNSVNGRNEINCIGEILDRIITIAQVRAMVTKATQIVPLKRNKETKAIQIIKCYLIIAIQIDIIVIILWPAIVNFLVSQRATKRLSARKCEAVERDLLPNIISSEVGIHRNSISLCNK